MSSRRLLSIPLRGFGILPGLPVLIRRCGAIFCSINKTTILELIQHGGFVEDLIALERNIRWDEGDKLFELFARNRKIRKEVIEAKQDAPEILKLFQAGRGSDNKLAK